MRAAGLFRGASGDVSAGDVISGTGLKGEIGVRTYGNLHGMADVRTKAATFLKYLLVIN